MTQSTLRIFTFFFLTIAIGSFGCANKSKVAKTKNAEKGINETTEMSVRQADQNLYLLLRLSKDDSTNTVNVLTVETQAYQKPGNPLPAQNNIDGKYLFTCEIKRQNGEIIQKAEQKINFTLGDSNNEAILKFILPLPEHAHHVEVKHLNTKGVWQTIYNQKL